MKDLGILRYIYLGTDPRVRVAELIDQNQIKSGPSFRPRITLSVSKTRGRYTRGNIPRKVTKGKDKLDKNTSEAHPATTGGEQIEVVINNPSGPEESKPRADAPPENPDTAVGPPAVDQRTTITEPIETDQQRAKYRENSN